MKHLKGSPKLPLRQRGMATILIIILMGMALTVTALGVMHSVRTSQDQQITVHAATHSQAGVWAAADALRLYYVKKLQGLDEAALIVFLEEINTKPEITINNISSSENEIKVKVEPLSSSPPYRIKAEISYTDIAAKSTSMLKVIYDVTPASINSTDETPVSTPVGNELIIKSDLELSGNLEFLADKRTALNVIGNITFKNKNVGKNLIIRSTESITIKENDFEVEGLYSQKNITINGKRANIINVDAAGAITFNDDVVVGAANAAGNITFEGKSSVDSTSSEGDIAIKGANSTVGTASAAGKIDITGASSVTRALATDDINIKNALVSTAHAGGTITASGKGSKVNTASAVGDINIDDSSIDTANAGGAITINGANVVIDNANAVGNIIINNSKSTVKNSRTMGGVFCSGAANGWNKYDSIVARVATADCNTDKVSINPELTILAPASPVVTSKFTKIELLAPRVDAYDFKNSANYVFRNIGGEVQVEVRNVAGINENDTFVKHYLVNGNSLCNALNIQCASDAKKICITNNCITYDKGRWKLSGGNNNTAVFAPGILWFEGDLTVNKGTYYNSIVATGNIDLTSNTVIYAANYNNSETCKDSRYSPTNLCGDKKDTATGNIALLAGSYQDKQFSGGKIEIGSNEKVYGNVLAGDALEFKGGPTIKGFVTVAGQGSSDNYKWNGNATIDTRKLPASYNPSEPPSIGGSQSSGSQEAKVEILWTRYL